MVTHIQTHNTYALILLYIDIYVITKLYYKKVISPLEKYQESVFCKWMHYTTQNSRKNSK